MSHSLFNQPFFFLSFTKWVDVRRLFGVLKICMII